jgi:cytochrome c
MNKTALGIAGLSAVLSAVGILIAYNSTHELKLGDAVRGEAVFEDRCSRCHALYRNDEGPGLAGIVGRSSGVVAGFPYSEALKNAHILWNDQTLDRWLTSPDAFVPGSGMPVRIDDEQQRRDVIAYLKAQTPPRK